MFAVLDIFGFEIFEWNSFEQDEPSVNALGYRLLSANKLEEAIQVFESNTRHHDSGNSWDSLGEAQLAAGKADQALESYHRSLLLTPNNDNARRAIAKLEAATAGAD